MRTRGAEAATTEMGRLGDEDPVTGTSSAARRYARAVFELATGEDRVDEWRTQLVALRQVLTDPPMLDVLRNPTIPIEQRMELVVSLKVLDDEATNLAKLLIEGHRVDEVAGVADEFGRLADEAAGRVRAVVTTAVELEAEDRDRVSSELSKRLGKDVTMEVRVDPRILGGLKLQYGDRVIDASVATRLQQLRRQLADAS
jgi:F-type H+-transporting ATPase subunit delta